MKKIAAVVLGLSALALAGCFDVEQTLTLEKDMSGKAGFSMKMDMNPMVAFMARMKRGMEGKEGDPTAEEIAAVRQEMLATRKSETKLLPTDKAEIAKQLPKGVTLLDTKVHDEGLKFGMDMLFGFDHVSKLQEINLKKPEPAAAKETEEMPGPGAQGPNPAESPFKGLQFVDEGDTFLVTSPAENPVAEQAEQAEQMEMSPEEKKQVEEMLGGLRVAFKITAPFPVVEHNAHRKDGNTLVWEYNLESLEKMKPEDMAKGVRVRYRKK